MNSNSFNQVPNNHQQNNRRPMQQQQSVNQQNPQNQSFRNQVCCSISTPTGDEEVGSLVTLFPKKYLFKRGNERIDGVGNFSMPFLQAGPQQQPQQQQNSQNQRVNDNRNNMKQQHSANQQQNTNQFQGNAPGGQQQLHQQGPQQQPAHHQRKSQGRRREKRNGMKMRKKRVSWNTQFCQFQKWDRAKALARTKTKTSKGPTTAESETVVECSSNLR